MSFISNRTHNSRFLLVSPVFCQKCWCCENFIFFEKKLAILKNVIYNTLVVHGWIPEWPKGADCKSVGTAFEGSNPSPSSEFSSYIFEM